MFKSCRAIICIANKRPKFIRIWANLESSSANFNKESQPELCRALLGVWKCNPGSVFDQLEAGASWAFSRTHWFDNGSAVAWLLLSIQFSMIKMLNEKKSRDHQYIHLAPCGDHVFHKNFLEMPSILQKSSQPATFPNQMQHYKWSCSVWAPTRATVQSIFAAETSSVRRCSSLLLNMLSIHDVRVSDGSL
jgi:hypothetical protein